jgi:hypothetical protein
VHKWKNSLQRESTQSSFSIMSNMGQHSFQLLNTSYIILPYYQLILTMNRPCIISDYSFDLISMVMLWASYKQELAKPCPTLPYIFSWVRDNEWTVSKYLQLHHSTLTASTHVY